MKALQVIIFQLVSFIIFVGIRYVSAIAAIMAGIGAADDYKIFERFVYIPSSLIQIGVLLYYHFNFKSSLSKLNAKIAIVFVLILTLLAFLDFIPGEIITLDKISSIFK